MERLCYVKIIVKCLKLGFTPIFLNELKIEIQIIIISAGDIFQNLFFLESLKGKNNLLLAVGSKQVYYHSITNENTNSVIFLNFIKELINKIKINKNNIYVLIMDNLPCHKKDDVNQFLVDPKINAVFTAPYNSSFNAVELSFRSIKRKTYSNIYCSLEEMKNDIINYLKSKEIEYALRANFNETIKQYIAYCEQKNSINLNSFNYID